MAIRKGRDDYLVGVITALPIERAAFTAMLDERHAAPVDFQLHPQDPNSYVWGSIGTHNIVMASLSTGVYGTTSAATTALPMSYAFPKIRWRLMVGIGAGIASYRNDIRLGDVVVSHPMNGTGGVFQYDFGKLENNEEWRRVDWLARPPEVLLKALGNLQAEHEFNGASQAHQHLQNAFEKHTNWAKAYGYPGADLDRLFDATYCHQNMYGDCSTCDQDKVLKRPERIPTDFKIHYGIIASGNSLVKNSMLRERIARMEDQCLCIEMEAAGLMNNWPCLVIRGICDYADSHKNDTWQRYASATAAAFAKDLLTETSFADSIGQQANTNLMAQNQFENPRKALAPKSQNMSDLDDTQSTSSGETESDPTDDETKHGLINSSPIQYGKSPPLEILLRDIGSDSGDNQLTNSREIESDPIDNETTHGSTNTHPHQYPKSPPLEILLQDTEIGLGDSQSTSLSETESDPTDNETIHGSINIQPHQYPKPPSLIALPQKGTGINTQLHQYPKVPSLIVLLQKGTGINTQPHQHTKLHLLLELKRRLGNNNQRLLWNVQYQFEKGIDFKDMRLYDIGVFDKGSTLLHYAVWANLPEVIEFLFENGAKTNVETFDIKSAPIHMLTENSSKEVIHLLLKHGADLNARNNCRETALHGMCKWQCDARNPAMEILLQGGALIDAQDIEGNTPLHIAAQYYTQGWIRSLASIKLLVENGANLDIRNNKGKRPIDLTTNMRSRRNPTLSTILSRLSFYSSTDGKNTRD